MALDFIPTHEISVLMGELHEHCSAGDTADVKSVLAKLEENRVEATIVDAGMVVGFLRICIEKDRGNCRDTLQTALDDWAARYRELRSRSEPPIMQS